MKRRRLVLIITTIIMSFLITSFTIFPLGEAQAAKKLKIGCIVPITNFPPGDSWARGYKLFEQKINEQGGVKIGDETYELEVIVEDSRFSPEGSSTAAKKLVYKDGVKFVFGEINESCIQAIYDVTSRAPEKVLCIMMWSNIPGHPADVKPNKPLFVRFSTSLDNGIIPDYKWIKDNYPNKKTVVITGPIVYEQQIQYYQPLIENLGFKVLGKELWPMELYQSAEFIPVSTKVVNYKPDVVHIWGTGMIANQLKALRELGFKGPVIDDCPLGAEVILRIAGPKNCYDLICNGIDPDHLTPLMAEVRDRWLKKYKEEWISDSVMAWDNLWVLMQVMQKVKSIDPEKVAMTVETFTKEGSLQTCFGPSYIGGQKRFGVNRVLVRPIPMVSFLDGKSNVIRYYLPEKGQE